MQRALLLLVVVAFIPRAAAAQGNPLGPEFRVNTYTTGYQSQPATASDSSGNFVVVWAGPGAGDPFPGGVFGQRYASTGAPLGPQFRVNTHTTNTQADAVVASDSSGNFVVVWHSYGQDGNQGGIFGQRYASTGEPLGSEFGVNTYTPGFQGAPAVASASSGNFVVVWKGQGPGDGGVFGQRYANTGGPLGPQFRVNTYTTQGQSFPAVASDASGNFVVVWWSYTQDGSSWGVYGQRYANTGAPLGSEFRVNTYTTNSQSGGAVASDVSGNFVVVWGSHSQKGDSGVGVFGQRYASTGVPLGPEFLVNTYTTHGQHDPAVASDASGNFVVVWKSGEQDGYGQGVFGQRYASTGAPLGPEFRVNTYTTSYQSWLSVASDSSGNFVVVWESALQDGSNSGIFGQRYSQIVPVELMDFRVE